MMFFVRAAVGHDDVVLRSGEGLANFFHGEEVVVACGLEINGVVAEN